MQQLEECYNVEQKILKHKNLNSFAFGIHTRDMLQIVDCFDTHCFTEEYQINKLSQINLGIWHHIEWLSVTYILEESDASIFRIVKEEKVALYGGGGS